MADRLEAAEAAADWWAAQRPAAGLCQDRVRLAVHPAGGVGLFAVAEVQAGALLAQSEPLQLAEGRLEDAEVAALAQGALKKMQAMDLELGPGNEQHLALFFRVLLELGRGLQRSPLGAYLAAWPTPEEVRAHFPLFWSDAELRELHGTQAGLAALATREAVEDSLRQVILPALEDRLELDSGRFTSVMDQAKYAFAAFHSRVLPSPEEGRMSALYPILEACNGSFEGAHNANFSGSDDGSLAIRASRALEPGEEVFCPYLSGLASSQVLTMFGAALDPDAHPNPWDSTTLLILPKVYKSMSASLLRYMKVRLGPNCVKDAGRSGLQLGNPHTNGTPRGFLDFMRDLEDLGPFAGLTAFQAQLQALPGTPFGDAQTAQDPAASVAARLAARVRLTERDLLSRWAFRLAGEMGLDSAALATSLAPAVCTECGGATADSETACGPACPAYFCADDHRQAHTLREHPRSSLARSLSATARSLSRSLSRRLSLRSSVQSTT